MNSSRRDTLNHRLNAGLQGYVSIVAGIAGWRHLAKRLADPVLKAQVLAAGLAEPPSPPAALVALSVGLHIWGSARGSRPLVRSRYSRVLSF
jgi:hypothetical protein